jgi:hypothetical protein
MQVIDVSLTGSSMSAALVMVEPYCSCSCGGDEGSGLEASPQTS